ncbi:hypothetical protein DAEQUDRAFT_738052 [Daedalea quercina L-15889]|uniref:Uncharacterized protein n=1 Tax=Daedalea quercina L-15889 TaxID=1314783 RepID=A0A165QL31_9APHY|nr:hypothetical protein DAEQUDRAFT_738052 [Daedalea quercina L-15889]
MTSSAYHGQYSQRQGPSAAPRANGQRVKPDVRNGHTQYSQPPPNRARSLSQPYFLDPPNKTDRVAGSPASPPMTNGNMATRIPMSRGRTSTGSNSSYAQNSVHDSASRMDEGSELRPVDEGYETFPMRSTLRMPRHKASELFDEAPPFSSSTSSHFQPEDDVLGRVSSDSEERPFEHWYRGDVSRNGGVGELRVGRRTEMLDIANYGHTFRNASSRVMHNGYQRSRSNSRSRDATSPYGRRQRAESVSAVGHSALLDEDELAPHDTVMDEQPPTDPESDGYEEPADPYEHHPDGTASSPALALDTSQNGTSITLRHRPGQTSQSRIPTPSSHRQGSVESHTPMPTNVSRNVSAPGTPTSASVTPRTRQGLPRSQTQPLQSSQRQKTPASSTLPTTAKRRAASPAASSSLNGAKKPKTNSKPPSSMPKKVNKEENRRSIGQYPTPDGDDVMDAIPSWTQPVPSTGNWDDVVLPVVARKRGLEDHYATADGSPKPPQKRGSEVFEPAPGTFGFDHTKIRRRPDANAEAIPMDEFGQKVGEDQEKQDIVDEQPTAQFPATPNPPGPGLGRSRSRPSPPPSPPPFAHYTNAQPTPIPAQPQFLPHGVDVREDKAGAHDDDGAGGCCKCVIM